MPEQPPLSEAEAARLAALRRYRVLDTEPEEAFDRIVHLARAMFDMPMAIISLLDDRRQWFKARLGLDVPETPRSWAFCNHAIRQDAPLVIPDARTDPRFADNPLVLGAPFLRFYAGAAIRTPDQQAIGTVCVLSPDPHASFSTKDAERLRMLADIVSRELELRLHAHQAERYAANLELLSHEIHNQVANSLQLVADVLEFQLRASRDPTVIAALKNALGRIGAVGQVHRQLRQQASNNRGDTKGYIGVLLRTLWRGLAPEAADRSIVIDVPDGLLLSTELLPRLGLAATELVMNSLRHGKGAISIAVRPVDEGITLIAEDEGPGVPETLASARSGARMGFQLIRMLAGNDSVSVDPTNRRRVVVRMRA